MKTTGLIAALLCLALVAAPQSAVADGWSWSSLNPLAKSSGSKKKSRSMTSTVTAPLVKTAKTVNYGTQRVVKGTVDVVTLKPWRAKPKSTQPSWANWNPNANAPAQKKSWFGWLAPKEEPPQKSGVTGWISQPRPGIDDY